MQPREKILAAILGSAVALFLLKAVYDKAAGAVSQRQARVAALQAEVDAQKLSVEAGNLAAAQIDDWNRRSLPSDVNLASGLYKNWLTALADQAKLSGVSVDDTGGSTHRDGAYRELTFTVKGRGGVPQLTQFLHDFYAAGHLHRIRTLLVKPGSGPTDMSLSFTISALVLPEADRESELSQDAPDPLGGRAAASYAAIAERKLFEPYVPPPPPVVAREERPRPEPPRPPAFNVAAHAVVTAILGVGDSPEAWVNVRTTGETLKLSEGDDFKVGTLSGKVVRINGRAMEFTSGGKRHYVALGDSLAKAVVVPDEEL